jgi:hypothetical protein
VIAHRPEHGGGGEARPPSATGAPDSSFDFRWVPERQEAPAAGPARFSSSASAAPAIARREGAENKIVIALTIACTAMALIDLFLLASGL